MFGPNAGGYHKGVNCWPRTFDIIATVHGHIVKGHSVSRAAELTFKSGLGTSPEANRKLWNRHRKDFLQHR
jgi:hypothetical protein